MIDERKCHYPGCNLTDRGHESVQGMVPHVGHVFHPAPVEAEGSYTFSQDAVGSKFGTLQGPGLLKFVRVTYGDEDAKQLNKAFAAGRASRDAEVSGMTEKAMMDKAEIQNLKGILVSQQKRAENDQIDYVLKTGLWVGRVEKLEAEVEMLRAGIKSIQRHLISNPGLQDTHELNSMLQRILDEALAAHREWK